jgi:GMP synthase-like glutamine amidotransferase
MNSSTVLVVQPDRRCPPGPLAEWLGSAGVAVDHRQCQVDELPEQLGGYAGLVVLGGAIDALDEASYPWLSRLRRLLAAAVTRQVPVLAVNLGAQLLALATGGSVRRMPEGPEVGTLMVAKRDAAVDDPLFAEVPFTPDVVQFHVDEVSALPGRATVMASSPRCGNQAFRVGQMAYGLQFHIETTPDVVLDWAARAGEHAEYARAGQLTRGHLQAVHADVEEVWAPFVARFGQLVLRQIGPAAPARDLRLA